MNDFVPTVISETATTITLGWTPDAFQQGYVTMLDGGFQMVDGQRHASTSQTAAQVKIGKPADETNPATKHSYGVMVLGGAAVGTYDPTVVAPPPPPPTNPPFFIGDFEGTGTAPTPLLVEAHPYGVTDSSTVHFGTYQKDSVIVHRGKYSGRVDLPAYSGGKTRGEFKTPVYPLSTILEKREAITVAYYVPSGWNTGTTAPPGSWTDCLTAAQWCWLGGAAGLNGGPISFGIFPDHMTFYVNSGLSSGGNVTQWRSNADNNVNQTLPPMWAIPASRWREGVWHELVMDVFWSVTNKGSVDIYHRIQDGVDDWAQTVSFHGFPTLAWLTDPSTLTGKSFYHKFGPYRWTHSDTPISFWNDTFSRCSTLQDALAYMGANSPK